MLAAAFDKIQSLLKPFRLIRWQRMKFPNGSAIETDYVRLYLVCEEQTDAARTPISGSRPRPSTDYRNAPPAILFQPDNASAVELVWFSLGSFGLKLLHPMVF